MMNGFVFGFGGIFMMLFWVVFLVFMVAGAVWLVSVLGRSQASTAQRILEERLARGEIDAEEFRTRRAVIGGGAR